MTNSASKIKYDKGHPRVALRQETYDRLMAIKRYQETADGLVAMLLDFYEDNKPLGGKNEGRKM